ncbi:MAG: aconitate hydratase AcnA [Pseudomonadota bacterium]|nr:aconitate hydratase AcnA [Pseudomonadota bacterium]
MSAHNCFDSLQTFDLGNGNKGQFYSLPALEAAGLGKISRMPACLRIVLEAVLRNVDGKKVTKENVCELAAWQPKADRTAEIPFLVARIVLQDFTGVPLLVDLAAMRSAVERLGKDPKLIEPLVPVDLVVDHSVQVDFAGSADALEKNLEMEFTRNRERYQFLKWGMQAFNTFKVIPPGIGIVHQVNLEYLAQGILEKGGVHYPDTLVGTDSHTTMINGLGVVGWGVGGIEAEAGMLGQPVYFLTPDVVGVQLTGELTEGVTATDLALTVTEMLRAAKVVGKFVEFYGLGAERLPLTDRATIANMAPEYGATCGFFPVDDETLNYMRLSGRDEAQIALVEAYCKQQGLWREPGHEPIFTDTLALDMGDVEASLAGPKRPQDRVALSQLAQTFEKLMADEGTPSSDSRNDKLGSEGGQTAVGVERSYRHSSSQDVNYKGKDFSLDPGAVVIAAITSCTNTSNPSVMMAAGLLARKAKQKGLTTKPWVKTSLAPGSKVVTDYLAAAGLQDDLNELGFNLVGYGCTTCIGNSGPLPEPIEEAVKDGDLTVASVLSGNRNFEGRVHPLVKTNWLASPPLVVAFALAGNVRCNLDKDPIGEDSQGEPVYLKDIWPSQAEVAEAVEKVNTEMFHKEYAEVFDGDEVWKAIKVPESEVYEWDDNSTYIQHPPFFEGMGKEPAKVEDVKDAHILAMLGDSVTTDHISPAGAIKPDSPAGRYLQENGVKPVDFNSYGSRRGNHEVMMRGTFANVRIQNEMLDGVVGGETRHVPSGEQMAIYDAAMKYQQEGTPLVVVAGKEYGTGSSRDWAAKGTLLLGVRAVLAESYERIHRSNLIGMGVVPLQFPEGEDRKSLGMTGDETVSIEGLDSLRPGGKVKVTIKSDKGEKTLDALCRIDTANELEYYRHGGILHYVLRKMIGAA